MSHQEGALGWAEAQVAAARDDPAERVAIGSRRFVTNFSYAVMIEDKEGHMGPKGGTHEMAMSGEVKNDLVKTADGWKIARREILLDQNVLLAKNLSTFF